MFKKLLVFAFACLVSGSSLADWRFKTPSGDSVTLHNTPCVSKAGVLAQIRSDIRPHLKAATVVWQEKTYEACWLDQGPVVRVVDESGDGGQLVKEAFEEVTPL